MNNLKSMPETDLSAILKQKQTGKNIILYDNHQTSLDLDNSQHHTLTQEETSGLSQKLKIGLDLSNVNPQLYGSVNYGSSQSSAYRYPKSTNKGV